MHVGEMQSIIQYYVENAKLIHNISLNICGLPRNARKDDVVNSNLNQDRKKCVINEPSCLLWI